MCRYIMLNLNRIIFSVEYLRGRSSGQNCLFCILMILLMYPNCSSVFCLRTILLYFIVLNVVKQEFKRIKTWFDVNKLSLNLEKTNFMIFSNRGRDPGASINIDGIEINRVRETKFLGVILDENVCWKSYIHYTKAKYQKQ